MTYRNRKGKLQRDSKQHRSRVQNRAVKFQNVADSWFFPFSSLSKPPLPKEKTVCRSTELFLISFRPSEIRISLSPLLNLRSAENLHSVASGGIGHMAKSKQQSFFQAHWDHRFCHGGKLRRSRHGRSSRPLSTRDPHHIVLKINRKAFRKGLRHPRTFSIVNEVIRQYAKRFFVKVEQFSVQHDHIYLLIRAPKRSSFQSFFRVVSGQIAQRVTDTFSEAWQGPTIWLTRPFSRVIKGYKAY